VQEEGTGVEEEFVSRKKKKKRKRREKDKV